MEISGMNELKENFMNQMREIDEKISQIQAELTKAQEYKIKLQGGLETLELLEKNPPNVFKKSEEVEYNENMAPGNGEGFTEEEEE